MEWGRAIGGQKRAGPLYASAILNRSGKEANFMEGYRYLLAQTNTRVLVQGLGDVANHGGVGGKGGRHDVSLVH